MKNTRGSEWNKWDLHIHTASSYDSPYKADDADELLCQALAENDIKAVAITDHFKIDKTRIEHLRKLAPEIVFFPGVELRTDKGANNLHLILIFSELSDLGDLEETIEFQAEMQLMDNDFSNKILSSISQRFAGVFKGKTEANNRITRLLRSTEFSDENSVLDLVNSIILAVDEDIDNSEKKITDKKEFYDYLYGLEYVGVSFKLKMGGRDLEELSPGERGIVLLIFYLALSQNSIPIIIDQPEDNLDNQSVYNKLVPCICAAKQKRQVIIVTHNPNIAVACDAEQIICCKMDKNTHKITYLSGAIEDQEIKQNVVDILEGTMPAFDLRRRKYV